MKIIRKSVKERKTGETKIKIEINLDGKGISKIKSPIGMLNHMLDQLARHGLVDIYADIEGDLETGTHHIIEDTAIVLGMCLDEALGNREGINRMGDKTCLLDEALCRIAIDLSGRGYSIIDMGQTDNECEFSVDMCRHFYEEFGLQTRIVRYHNVYGTYGTFDGGREKAPAAICRKVAEAKIKKLNTIEIWGDGKQTRSFLYIDDCIEGTLKLFNSNYTEPLNIGSDEQVSINQLVDIAEDISSLKLERKYLLDKPKGVRGRSSNNERLKKVLNWNYSVKLKDGIKKTYDWIYKELTTESTEAKKFTRDTDLLV